MFLRKDKPIIRERSTHSISRANIDPDAVKVLYRLVNNNFIAYLVGGSVRDLLLGREPKDFDISTDAKPAEIRKLFRNCFLIGRRFRLAHIVFGRKVIETSTFRGEPKNGGGESGLYQIEDNTFGSPAEDARRRDFTVNGLFYDIKNFTVIDYVGGLKDLERKVIRSIGIPGVRFREDPVRMMRAVRFAAKLDFTLDKSCCRAIQAHHTDILNASMPRICEEVFRLFTVNASESSFRMMWRFRLLEDLVPQISDYIDRSGGESSPLWKYLAALDAAPENGGFSNGLRTAVLCYPLFVDEFEKERKRIPNGRVNRINVARKIAHPLSVQLNVPKAVVYTAVAVIEMLPRFDKAPVGARSERFARSVNFAEAFLFRKLICTAEKTDFPNYDQWYQLEQEARQHRGASSSDEVESSTRRKRQHRGKSHRRRKSSK
jgi:poly(A) polymerase